MRCSKGPGWDYDYRHDSLFSYTKEVPDGVEYVHSLDIDGIIIDIGTDNSILNIEVLNISKKLNVSKTDIQHPEKLEIKLKISDNAVEIRLSFFVRKKEKVASASSANDLNLPPGLHNFSVCAE